MNSFYSNLYGKFAELQIEQKYFSAKLVYPIVELFPFLKIGEEISDCKVGIPPIRISNNIISYGFFVFEDSEFGQSAAVKLVMASTCLLSAKSIFHWIYRNYTKKWSASKVDSRKASFVINTVLDVLARQRILKIEGEEFYNDVMRSADTLSSMLLARNPKDFSELIQRILISYLLGVPVQAPTPILKTTQNFMSKLNTFQFDGSKVTDIISDSISPDGNYMTKHDKPELMWEKLVNSMDELYSIIAKVQGSWNSIAYLPYCNDLADKSTSSLFKARVITEQEFGKIGQHRFKRNNNDEGAIWQEIFFELLREEKRKEKMLTRLSHATNNLNFADIGIPICDYVSYHKLYAELGPQIRKIIERVRMVKNTLDENTFQESGNIDLQVAIQAIASETPRNDIFTRDENLLKSESWTILVDSSLSLGGSSKEVKAVSICLAETAREIMGSSPWGMFAFSDELYCIKDFIEPYDNHIRSRIGGLKQHGLSYIPDAIRACRSLISEYTKDRNYLILVSDGNPSGYIGIEQEFVASIKELGKYSIDLAAIGIGGSAIRKAIRRARIINEPADIVKEFMEIYLGLSA